MSNSPTTRAVPKFDRGMRTIMSLTRVMPVVTIQDPGQAGQLARTLVDAGLLVFEVVLRTPMALQALLEMRRAAPEAIIGAGTLLNAQDVEGAIQAGASFGVSPGCTPELAAAVREHGFPFLPGVATASEIMQARDLGFRELKLFPAQGSAGVAWLKDMGSVFPDVMFCPTGGIRPPDVPAYLALPNCAMVGGSWVVPGDALNASNWSAISALAKEAAGMKKP
jgi:2-dehydro-3-deoxyphosphogluconate aldolase / (4S)-4-hydroxy-2-oxoglutarate aldolase